MTKISDLEDQIHQLKIMQNMIVNNQRESTITLNKDISSHQM